MTIESEINRIKQNIADCYTTLTAKGATIPATENVDNLAACILTIPTTVEEDFVTQSGDTIVTSAGTPLAIDGISSLTTAPSITDTQLTFADDSNSTVSFSMQQLKDYVSPAPATTLHQYDRVDGKATVVDFWTDGDDQRYAVCVVDAQYRSGSGMQAGIASVNTILPDYSTEVTALAAEESSTYNTDTILNNYSSTDYAAFDFARNACTVTVDGQSFEGCLPNIKELNLIYTDKATLDTYDPTLSSYSARSLTEFKFGSEYGAWSSTEDTTRFWLIFYDGALNNTFNKQSSQFGVCPIIEIPVDANGTVITI